MHILAIKNSIFSNVEPEAFVTGHNALHLFDKIQRESFFAEREALETDETNRQVIPYILVENRQTGKFVLMHRCKGQGEERLLGKFYIGAGGHVERPENYKGLYLNYHSIITTVHKELEEELGIKICSDDTLTLQGILLQSSEVVCRVHVGLFYHLITDHDNFNSQEKHLHDARWADVSEIREKRNKLEGWSKLIYWNYLQD